MISPPSDGTSATSAHPPASTMTSASAPPWVLRILGHREPAVTDPGLTEQTPGNLWQHGSREGTSPARGRLAACLSGVGALRLDGLAWFRVRG